MRAWIGAVGRPGARTRRLVPLVIALFLLAASWGPGSAGSDGEPAPAAVMAPVARPAPTPVATPASAPRPALAPSVIVHEPDLIVEPDDDGDSSSLLNTISARDDIDYVAGAVRFEATLASQVGTLGGNEETVGADEPLVILAVNPVSFRPLTPDVTAQAVPVWEKLLDGEAVVRHEVAFQRGLSLGETVTVQTESGEREYRVGALAANGVPSMADIVVPHAGVQRLAVPDWNIAIVSASEGVGPVWLGEQIVRDVGGTFERLDEPTSSNVPGWGSLETFTYVDTTGGRIEILGDWVSRFIVTVDLPIVGRTQCNRLMVPQLVAALGEVATSGLAHLIDANDFGGCWVPRHIDWNPGKSISMHAWGLAIDLNVNTNGLGRTPTMDGRIVDIFRKWGFYWGGWWDRPDGMHFQLNQFMAVD